MIVDQKFIMIEKERANRLTIWQNLITKGGPKKVSPTLLREMGIYGGAQGIYVEKERTAPISPDGAGITIGLLHTSSDYPDELAEDGILYHYPSTNRPPIRDSNEIEATKNAGRLGIPVFVITRPTPSSTVRDIFLGWVEGWDDDSKLFLVTFGETRPSGLLLETRDDETFDPRDETARPIAEISTRPGQHKFRFLVMQRYGLRCAVCDLDIPELLDTAHLIPKSEKGSDDPRNGLVLCANHHRALEMGLFGIHPETKAFHFKSDGPDSDALKIQRRDIRHLRKYPHEVALTWLWENTFIG